MGNSTPPKENNIFISAVAIRRRDETNAKKWEMRGEKKEKRKKEKGKKEEGGPL